MPAKQENPPLKSFIEFMSTTAINLDAQIAVKRHAISQEINQCYIASISFRDSRTSDEVAHKLKRITYKYGTLGIFLAGRNILGDPLMGLDEKHQTGQITKNIHLNRTQAKELLSQKIERIVTSDPMIQSTDTSHSKPEFVTRTAEICEVLENGDVVLTNPITLKSKKRSQENGDFSNWGKGWETWGVGNVKFHPSRVQHSLSLIYNLKNHNLKLIESISFSNLKAKKFPRMTIKVHELVYLSDHIPESAQLMQLAELFFDFRQVK